MEKTKKELLEEIADLQEQVRRLQGIVNEQKHLSDAVAAKDKEIGSLSQQMSTKWQKQLDEKEGIIKYLVDYVRTYQQTFQSFLKNVQGGLENAVELEALLTEKLNKK